MGGLWDYVESGPLPADAIMERDARLLQQLNPTGCPLLHIYQWASPCLTYGHFTDPHRHLHVDRLNPCGLHMARRPTGGGIIFHGTDFAFSVLIPASHPRFSLNTLDNYALINRQVAEAIVPFTASHGLPELLARDPPCAPTHCLPFCMAKPTRYDLIINGKKVGGAAQRRSKNGLLHQASLSLLLPTMETLHLVLKEPQTVLEAMQTFSRGLLLTPTSPQSLQKVRIEITRHLQQSLFSI